jgi:hypothetical protein
VGSRSNYHEGCQAGNGKNGEGEFHQRLGSKTCFIAAASEHVGNHFSNIDEDAKGRQNVIYSQTNNLGLKKRQRFAGQSQIICLVGTDRDSMSMFCQMMGNPETHSPSDSRFICRMAFSSLEYRV